ncbi:MAG: hypothetical protein KJ658_04340, partial [Proteobacteria bacterium]|nr:hypothetical protein [Pseudomonadota bacterium]
MKSVRISNPPLSQVGIEGALMTLSSLPFVFASLGVHGQIPAFWRLGLASFAGVSCLVCAFTLFRRPQMGKFFGGMSFLGSFAAALPYLVTNPVAALLGIVTLIGAGFTLLDFQRVAGHGKNNTHENRSRQRVRWAIMTIPVIIGISMMTGMPDSFFSRAPIAATAAIMQVLFVLWAWQHRPGPRFLLPLLGGFFFISVLFSLVAGHTATISLVIGLVNL